VFEAGDGNDGRLTAAEMFGLPLERARLVVLSACETGRSRADNAGDVQGMLRALLYAGAGGVVLSYWAVDSDATAAWMEAFHRAARDRHPAEAARSALAAVKSRKEYAHPYYWAAFMTVGR
jgi:CHAT domain-containing protein